MAIYTIGGIKGGSGKTTVATNLTVLLASHGRDVLLVDADEQETATDFTAWRNQRMNGQAGYTAIQLSDESVRTEILKMKSKYDDIVIDTGGRDTTSQRAALTITEMYLIPFVPRSFDVWTMEKVIRLINEIKPINPSLRSIAFLNKADARGSDNEDASEQLKEETSFMFIDAQLGLRKAFSNASSKGMAVTELRPRDKKAIEELSNLLAKCAKAMSYLENRNNKEVETI